MTLVRDSSLLVRVEPGQELRNRESGNSAPLIGDAIGNNQRALVNHVAAAIDHVGYVPIPFMFIGYQYRIIEAADNLRGVVNIQ